jgi:putative ABC transport system permease protein
VNRTVTEADGPQGAWPGGARSLANFARLAGWFVLRRLARRPARFAAVVLGVALGASVFLSVRLCVSASVAAYRQGMDAFTGSADAAVTSPGARLDESLVSALLRLPGVTAASPVVAGYALAPDGRPVRVIGVDPLLDRPFRSFAALGARDVPASWFELPARPGAALLGSSIARRLGLKAYDSVTLKHAGEPSAFTVLGVLTDEGLAGTDGGNLVLVDISTAQEFLGLTGKVGRIDLKFAPGSGAEAVRAVLPRGVTLASPGAARDSGLGMIGAYRQNLTVLSFFSLFVGMFLIYGLISLDAAARRKELAILRSLGASRPLILSLFLFQGAFTGLAGWLCGLPLAALLTGALLQGVSATINNLFVRVAVDQARADPAEAALSLALTLAVSLLAALGPALSATRVPPREALAAGARAGKPSPLAGRFAALAGLFLALSAWPICLVPAPAGFPLTGYLAIGALFAGLALLAPSALGLTLGLFSLLPARSAPARLALASAASGAGRAAVSAGALATAVALFIALSTMIHGFRASFVAWLDQTVTGDLFVRPVLAEANDYDERIPPGLAEWVRRQPGVTALPYLRRYVTLNGAPCQFEATDMAVLLDRSTFDILDALPDAKALLLSGRGVAVAESLAHQANLSPGSPFAVQAGGAAMDAVVAAVVRSYRTRGGEAYYDMEAFRALGGDPGVSGLRLYLDGPRHDLPERIEALRAAILSGPHGQAVEAISGAGLHAAVTRIFDQTFAVTGVLLVVALGVAALGISVTLTVRVLERSRELSTLSAVGASRGQITAMILWEALYLGLAGEMLGVIGGFGLSFIVIHVINKQSFGWSFAYLPDWQALALSLPLVLAAALAAGPPARRAALSRPPAEALRES